MFGRVVITLAAAAAGATLLAGPASATTVRHDGGFAARESVRGGFSFENLGGPWGITRVHGRFDESRGILGEIDR